jgi:hypothetical protein
MRTRVILAVAASLALATGLQAAPKDPLAGKLKTDAFLAACVVDPNVVELPGLEAGSKVTVQAYCDCVAGALLKGKLSQTDVDMLTKVHKDAVTDEDAKTHPTLDDLLSANEGLEDGCKASLGLPAAEEDEEAPADESAPSDDSAPSDEDAPPPD